MKNINKVKKVLASIGMPASVCPRKSDKENLVYIATDKDSPTAAINVGSGMNILQAGSWEKCVLLAKQREEIAVEALLACGEFAVFSYTKFLGMRDGVAVWQKATGQVGVRNAA